MSETDDATGGRLEGKAALVTGASSGLGRATAIARVDATTARVDSGPVRARKTDCRPTTLPT